MAVTSYLYDAKGRDQKVDLSAETLKSIGKQRLLWVDVDERDAADLKQVARALGLEPMSLRRLMKPDGTRLENFENYIQLVVETAPAVVDADHHASDAPRGASRPHTRLDFIISKEWLLTVHDGTVEFIKAFRARDPAETTIGALTAHDFAASLLDLHLEAFFQEIARIEGLSTSSTNRR